MNRYLKLTLVIALSFFVSSFAADTFFLAKTPKLRPNVGQYLAQKYDFTTKAKNFIASLNIFRPSPRLPSNGDNTGIGNTQPSFNQNNAINTAANTGSNLPASAFKQVSKGVYAAEEPTLTGNKVKEVQLRLDEVQWQEQSTVVNGKKCSINFVQGVDLPKEVLEKICQQQ